MKSTLLLVLASALFGQTGPRRVGDDEVRKVHASALLIDTHNDITSRTVAGLDIGKPAAGTHTDIPRLRQGGVGAVFFAVYVGASYERGNRSAHRALEMIDTVRNDIAGRNRGAVELAFSAAEIESARRNGRIAALMGIEGGHAIENSLRLLRGFHALGIRYMTLTHSNTNAWADSSGDIDNTSVKHHGGLTDFGRQVIAEMNRLGMLVDISHVSDKTFYDALEASRAPIFASHSSARALANVPRNMSDDMIRALAKKGGVVHVNFGCDFLSDQYATALRALGDKRRDRAERAKLPRPGVADVVAHIDHIVKLGGIGAVGIGSDFDGVGCVPEGLDDVSKFPNLTRALLERGYSAEDIRKIYGGNFLRVFREAERVASEN